MSLSTMVATVVLAQSQDARFTKDLLSVGSTLPSFVLEGTSGKAEYKGSGKAAVVAFWHVGSRESAVVLGDLEAFQSEYGRSVSIFAVNIGDDKERVAEFLKANKVGLNVGLGGDGEKASYGVRGYPTIYVADKGGTIVFRDHRPDKATLERAVKSVAG